MENGDSNTPSPHSRSRSTAATRHACEAKIPIRFYALTALFALMIFAGNRRHFREQGIFRRQVLLAQSVLAGDGYQYPRDQWPGNAETGPAFFPVWGYPLFCLPGVWLGHTAKYVLVAQYLLSMVGLFYFYKTFDLKERFWHIPLLWPYFIMASVKWADAVACILVLPYIYYTHQHLVHGRRRHLFLSGILLGLMATFRSEYLVLVAFQLAVVLLPHVRQFRRRYLVLIGSQFLLTLAVLSPWAIRAYLVSSHIYFTGANGGMVSYISLGQLPDNPWHIKHSDAEAFAYTHARGERNTVGPEGDRMLKQEFRRLVLAHPGAYARKVWHNLKRALNKGVYMGDACSPYESPERESRVQAVAEEHGWRVAIQKTMTARETADLLFWRTLVRLYSIIKPMWLVLLLMFVAAGFMPARKPQSLLFAIILGLVIHKIAIVSLLQHQPRHMNPIWMPVLGFALLGLRHGFLAARSRFSSTRNTSTCAPSEALPEPRSAGL